MIYLLGIQLKGAGGFGGNTYECSRGVVHHTACGPGGAAKYVVNSEISKAPTAGTASKKVTFVQGATPSK